jgi:hypothetical protein
MSIKYQAEDNIKKTAFLPLSNHDIGFFLSNAELLN